MANHDVGLSSMTGYGQASGRVDGWRLRVECRSVNHKRLSIRVHTPDALRWSESAITKRIRSVLERGRVEVHVQLEPVADAGGPGFDAIDESRFEAVVAELQRLAAEHQLATPVRMESLEPYREFFERRSDEVISADNPQPIVDVVDDAVEQLIASRREEGRGLCRELVEYLGQLRGHLEEITTLRAEGDTKRHSRVEARLREAIESFDIDELDESRLHQEVAYYVEKGDISEEIQRAAAHLQKLDSVVETSSTAVGKKIDFYLQELIRETNTMGSKSRHPKLTERVIEMKSLIEKMREQAANIE